MVLDAIVEKASSNEDKEEHDDDVDDGDDIEHVGEFEF